MAYSTYGKKVYASIQDLPQYDNITNGDKIIVWNETKEGAAVVDYANFVIDLDHTTFKSTISEIINFASSVENFTYTVNQEINSIKSSIEDVQSKINEQLICRIKTLEFIIAVILGANSYWLTSAGLDVIREKFLIEGISNLEASFTEEQESDDAKNSLRWYNGLMSTIQNYISKVAPGAEYDDILLQSKFSYRYTNTAGTSSSSEGAALSLTRGATVIKTVNTSSGTTTSIKYNLNDNDLENELKK